MASQEESAIDRFIAKSHQMMATPAEEHTPLLVTAGEEEWDNMASGVDPSDYQPKTQPVLYPIIAPSTDTGRTPNMLLSQTKQDVEDFFAEPGVCGLFNLGNTCYMNAGLQCIRSVPNIAQFYLSDNVPLPNMVNTGSVDDVDNKIDATSLSIGHVSARFGSLMKKIWAGRFSAVVPQNFKTTLGIMHSQFSGYRQQDCQEFLALLLDTLNEDICHSLQYKSSNHINSVITDTFQGQLKNKVTCCVCGHTSVKYDPFVCLSVPLPHSNERQIDIYWSSVIDNKRQLIKLLAAVPKIGTVEEIKQVLCDMMGGVQPSHVTIAHVKNHYIESTLANSLDIKHINDRDYELYAFHNETTPSFPTVTSPTVIKSNMQSSSEHGGYTLLDNSNDADDVTMETSPASNDPWQPNETGLPAKIARNESEDETTPLLIADAKATPIESEATPLLMEGGASKVVIMEWHTCVICLEEMIDSELMTHESCGATLCSNCIEASVRHSSSESGHIPCPVCQAMVLPNEHFTALATANDNTQSIVRLLQMIILFRNVESDILYLFGYPCILNVPSTANVDVYYQIIAPLVPINAPWSLVLTDGKGLYCSRCLYGSGCRGCVLNNTMKDVSLKPGDHLTVSYHELPPAMIQEASKTELHSSLQSRWASTISLNDCLDLFTQKEMLGSDNPWLCPVCNKNQSAIRHLTVSQFPLTLVIHLKRFLFHGNMASKVDTGIVFPHSLNLLHSDTSIELSLISCVCHFGSLNSGHYTAYCKQPTSGKWYYYNDETLTEVAPSDKDKESVYILLYNQKDSNTIDLPTERGGTFPTDEEELQQLEPLLRTLKPKPLPPPPLPIKKSSSTGNLTDIEGQDVLLQQQLTELLTSSSSSSTGLKASTSNPSLVDSTVQLKSVKLKAFDV